MTQPQRSSRRIVTLTLIAITVGVLTTASCSFGPQQPTTNTAAAVHSDHTRTHAHSAPSHRDDELTRRRRAADANHATAAAATAKTTMTKNTSSAAVVATDQPAAAASNSASAAVAAPSAPFSSLELPAHNSIYKRHRSDLARRRSMDGGNNASSGIAWLRQCCDRALFTAAVADSTGSLHC